MSGKIIISMESIANSLLVDQICRCWVGVLHLPYLLYQCRAVGSKMQLKSSEFGGAMYYLECSLFTTRCHLALWSLVCPALTLFTDFCPCFTQFCAPVPLSSEFQFHSFLCSCLHPVPSWGLLGCADPQDMERPWVNLSFSRVLLLQPPCAGGLPMRLLWEDWGRFDSPRGEIQE